MVDAYLIGQAHAIEVKVLFKEKENAFFMWILLND
jgi:hypothetical protein